MGFPEFITSLRAWNSSPLIPKFEDQIERDITDLTILLVPGLEADSDGTLFTEIDLAVRADFEDAKAGPITGVAPRP